MIEEIIFDCFGVLTQDGWTAFINKYASSENEQELRDLNTLADKGLIDYPEFLKRVSVITGVDSDTAHTIVTTSLHPNEEVFTLAHNLTSSYKLGIISNVGSPLTNYFEHGKLRDFSVQTLSFELGVVKPAPEIYKLHLAKSGVTPDKAVFIDDRAPNCEGARAVGMHAIHYQNYEQLVGDLQKLGVTTV